MESSSVMIQSHWGEAQQMLIGVAMSPTTAWVTKSSSLRVVMVGEAIYKGLAVSILFLML